MWPQVRPNDMYISVMPLEGDTKMTQQRDTAKSPTGEAERGT